MRARRLALALPFAIFALSVSGGALAVAPSTHPTPSSAAGVGMLRLLGPEATTLYAPESHAPSALVALPAGQPAAALGLEPVSPGIGRVRGSRETLLAFADAHPTLPLEIAPPLHLLNDSIGVRVRSRAAQSMGVTGKGVLVGIADTGLDGAHPDFQDDAGHSRIAWLLDFSRPPAGLHTDLEAKYSVYVEATNQRFGAIYTGAEIDALRETGQPGSSDSIGHGTHVAGIAAADDGSPAARTVYSGVAPEAGLLIVRLTRGTSQSIENDDLVRAVGFMFDRADAEKKPCVVNLSLGSDFGAHDGSSLWEQAIVTHIGSDKPGHVLVAAAGNSGAAPVLPIHQSVHVVAGTRTAVPIDSGDEGGNVSVWINFRNATDMKVGLRGPDEEWIAPLPDGRSGGRNRSGQSEQYNAAVVVGASAPESPIQAGSQAAVVGWQGSWPKGEYQILLEGDGDAELYLQAVGATRSRQAAFLGGMREGTINLPADNPLVLAVGATVNRIGWTSKNGQEVSVRSPLFDTAGDIATGETTGLRVGDVAFFSSAGPNALGVPKPEIAAPGAVVTSALSGQAPPTSATSIFNGSRCPNDRRTGKVDAECMLVDDLHAVTSGTSMASPVVTGAVALLLQREPTLTQSQAIALIQAGAHRHATDDYYSSQAAVGELDVLGSLAALARMQDPREALPAARYSWIALGNDYWDADGKTAMVAMLELRNLDNEPADLFDTARLTGRISIGSEVLAPPAVERLAPGLYRFRALAPAGRGGELATFSAQFDGVQVVGPRTVPIGLDGWRSRYPTTLGGGCNTHGSAPGGATLAVLGLALLVRRRARRAERRRLFQLG